MSYRPRTKLVARKAPPGGLERATGRDHNEIVARQLAQNPENCRQPKAKSTQVKN